MVHKCKKAWEWLWRARNLILGVMYFDLYSMWCIVEKFDAMPQISLEVDKWNASDFC